MTTENTETNTVDEVTSLKAEVQRFMEMAERFRVEGIYKDEQLATANKRIVDLMQETVALTLQSRALSEELVKLRSDDAGLPGLPKSAGKKKAAPKASQ